jgi:hypothetical protein
MSWDFYRAAGYMQVTPKYKEIDTGNANSIVWTPTSSLRIALTNLTLSSAVPGTIAFFFGGKNQIKLGQFYVAGSITFSPDIDSWESTATDAPLYAVVSGSSAAPWTVTAEGFEID